MSSEHPDIKTALATCLDPEEYHDVARFTATTDGRDWSIEFGTHGEDPPVWNLASDPPVGRVQFNRHRVRDHGRGYVLLTSYANTNEDAYAELQTIAERSDADEIVLETTFSGATGNVGADLRDMFEHHVLEPLRNVRNRDQEDSA